MGKQFALAFLGRRLRKRSMVAFNSNISAPSLSSARIARTRDPWIFSCSWGCLDKAKRIKPSFLVIRRGFNAIETFLVDWARLLLSHGLVMARKGSLIQTDGFGIGYR